MARCIGTAAFTAAGEVRDVAAEWTLQMATGLALSAGDFVF